MNENPICREMCLWALNNDHPIHVIAKHLFKMGCSSNISPEVQENYTIADHCFIKQ